jgi:arginase family enzyme
MTRQRDPLPVFSGIPSFCRLPQVDRSDLAPGMVAIAGVAFDLTCTGRIGSRFGPRGIREASLYFAGYGARGSMVEGSGEQPGSPSTNMVEVSIDKMMAFPDPPRIVDINDLNIYPVDLPRTESAIADAVDEIVSAGALPVILGGDEYVTLPVLKGCARAWKTNGARGVGYVQVSGHLSLGDEHPAFGKSWGGATARRIMESGVVEPTRMAWLGVHGRCRGEEWDLVQERNLWMQSLAALRREGPKASADAALERAGSGGGPVLVGLDMSVLSGVFASGTSEAAFDGLTNTEMLMLMDALAREPANALVLTGVNSRIEATWTAERLATVAVLRFLAPRFMPPSQESVAAEAEAVGKSM